MGGHPLRPPTYRSLGEPLPHQQANRTHAHLLPPELSSLDHEAVRAYGALIRISSGYSPVRGRLHTRYAPVRRSQTSEDILPLDLHVLGLPLAFILSQDQTLHRRILKKYSCRLKTFLKGYISGVFVFVCFSSHLAM